MGREILYSEVNLYYDEVMDYSYILHSAVPLVEKFQAVGFEKAGDEYVCKKTIDVDGSIPDVVDRHSIFSAWHMNKKHWITVLLTAVTDFEKLCELTLRSFELVGGKK